MKGIPVSRTYDWQRAMVGKLSPTELALAFVLSVHMDNDGTLPERFTPSIATLTKEMGLAEASHKTTLRAMAALEEAGFLAVTRRGRGRKLVNLYRATVPVVEEPVQEPEKVADAADDTGSSATLPTRSKSNPHPVRTVAGAAGDLLSRRRVASNVAREICDRLPPAEAEAVAAGIEKLRQRDALRDALYEAAEAGVGWQLVEAVTATPDGFPSSFHGARNPAGLLWKRVDDFMRVQAP